MKFTRTMLAAALAIGSAQFVIAQDKPAEEQKDKAPASQPAGPIDYKKLKEQLPQTLAGCNRTEASGEKTGLGDFKVSMARGTYVKDKEKDDSPRIELQIQDFGTNKQMIEGMSYWTKLELDKEGDDGFQKTLKIQEQPAMQEYRNDGKSGTLTLVVGERYFVTVNSTGLTADEFKKIGDELKLKELAALK